MTIDEFNDKWTEYLEPGHYGLAIDDDAIIEFLDTEAMPFLAKQFGFSFSQIKLKFNSARFYAKGVPLFVTNGIESRINWIIKRHSNTTG